MRGPVLTRNQQVTCGPSSSLYISGGANILYHEYTNVRRCGHSLTSHAGCSIVFLRWKKPTRAKPDLGLMKVRHRSINVSLPCAARHSVTNGGSIGPPFFLFLVPDTDDNHMRRPLVEHLEQFVFILCLICFSHYIRNWHIRATPHCKFNFVSVHPIIPLSSHGMPQSSHGIPLL